MKHLTALTMTLLITACSATEPEPDNTIIYPAQGVITVDASNSIAEAVAVSDGTIVGVGSTEHLKSQFPNALLDSQHKSSIIIPGLIDPHVHMTVSYTHLTLPTKA